MQEQRESQGGGLGSVLLGVAVGVALQLQEAQLGPWPAYALLAFAGIVAAAFIAPKFRALRRPALLLGAAALAFACVGLRALAFQSGALDATLEGRDIAITGVVSAMPQRTDTGLRLRMKVESARASEGEVRVPPLVQLGWYDAAAAVEPGERWQLTVRLKAPHGHVNPGGFDYELWLWEQGVQATGYVRSGPRDPPPRRIGRTWRHPVEQMRYSVREAIFARVEDRRLAGVLAALVVGDQAAIERADWDVFRATGVAHLMSISGLHVTMFAWFAAAAVGALWRRSPRACLWLPAQHAALLGGLVLATGYALFSGWGVPAQRTIWMLATIGLLRLSGREWPWPWVWLLACAVVVAVDPWAMLQAGFWLSFVAVGVLFASELPRQPRHPREGGDPVASAGKSHWIPAFAGMTVKARALAGMTKALLREQWIVTLALTPLALILFGQVSVIGLAANLVAIPWVTLLVTPLALGGIVIAPLWDAAAWLVQVLALGLDALARVPFATVSVAAAPLWAGAAGVLGGLLVAMPWPWALRALGVPLLLPVLLWQPVRPAPGEFELLAVDVGQGNALIVRTATHTLVYDAGPRYGPESDAGHRVLVPLLRQLGERVDMLVLSHRDTDHTGGAVALLGMQTQAQLLSSIEAAHELQVLRPATRCEAGQRWNWDGVDFEVLHPTPADYTAAGKPNAVSCVLRIATPRAAALLAGDIEQAQEARLLAAANLRADVLLVPHHGSKTSSSEAFIDAVRPRFALVQAGYRNRFGHPAAPVAARYRERGIALVESARCGAALWHSERPDALDCRRDSHPRYWYHRAP